MGDEITRMAAPLRQQVTALIRESIITQQYRAGDRLVERVLCERFSVSRTVIREALRQLEAEGLTTTIANRGPVVASLTTQEVVDLYEVRTVLEALAGKLFASRASDAQLERLQKQLELTTVALLGPNILQALAEKDKFYDIILDGAGNEIIRADLRSIHARVSLLRAVTMGSPDRVPETVRELQGIVEAAVGRDPQLSWDRCWAHVKAAQAAAIAALESTNLTAELEGINS